MKGRIIQNRRRICSCRDNVSQTMMALAKIRMIFMSSHNHDALGKDKKVKGSSRLKSQGGFQVIMVYSLRQPVNSLST